MVIAQIDGERTIHLLVNQQHQDIGDDERHKCSIACHESIAYDSFQEGLAFFMSMSLRFCFRDGTINNHCHETTDDRIDHEQIEEIDVRQKSAAVGTTDRSQVSYHSQHAQTQLPLMLRHDVGKNSFMRTPSTT